MESMLSQMFDQMQEYPPNLLFLRTLWAVTFVSILFGAVFRPYHCRRVVACAQTVRYPVKRIGTYRE